MLRPGTPPYILRTGTFPYRQLYGTEADRTVMTAMERIEIRVAPEVKQELAEAAAKEKRSLSSFLLVAAYDRIEQKELTEPATTTPPKEPVVVRTSKPKPVKKVEEKLHEPPAVKDDLSGYPDPKVKPLKSARLDFDPSQWAPEPPLAPGEYRVGDEIHTPYEY